MSETKKDVPSYHDLFITTAAIPRRSLSNLPYGLEVSCTRVNGWTLWDISGGFENARHVAGEYGKKGLRLDVAGHVICDSLTRVSPEAAR